MEQSKKLLTNFQNFIQSKGNSNFTKSEIKLINLISKNIGIISEVGTAVGKRAKLISDLFLKQWSLFSEELLLSDELQVSNVFPIIKLHTIEINNFRGFSTKFDYKFDKPYTLIYGTNGSGKTSFCEALEFSMLGYINEAESKRIDTTKYITNLTSGRANSPILKAIDTEGMEINITASPNDYHFCFIEKNRIDGFARISANTPKIQSELLSTLFGLEEFSLFVSEFTDNIEKYVDIEGEKAKLLLTKTREIENHHLTIKNSEQSLIALNIEKEMIVKESELQKTYDEIVLYINGANEVIGKIKQIDLNIQNINTTHYETSSVILLTKGTEELNSIIQEFRQLVTELEFSKDKVNYRKLFAAVKELEYISKDICPACLTPIENVVLNPFDNARQKLLELERLAILEEQIDTKNEKIIENTKEIIKDIQIKNKFAKELGYSFEFSISSDLFGITKHTLKDNLKVIENFTSDIYRNKEALIVLDNLINHKNEEFEKSSPIKNALLIEKDHLQKISNRINDLRSKEDVYNELINKSKLNVQEFILTNESLINEVKSEKEQILINNEFVKTYKSLINKMKIYNIELPRKLVTNLNELVCEFYNEINKHDSIFEHLSKIELPSKQNESIIAYFKDNPSKPIDALHVLSEGHVRCLGLSILLAKIVKDKIGLIIFDDVVNAIDDDHRGGIRELLLGNEKINTKQIILTSHAEEFIKDLENQVEKKIYKDYINKISFLPPVERKIRVDLMSSSNYLSNAQINLEKSQKRECLRNCRSALENINSVIWKKLGNKYNTSITVKIRQPKSMPDSMSTVLGLSQFLKKTVKEEKYNNIVEIYDFLSGLEATHNTVWNYLNKGTHEEEGLPEFDLLIVNELFSRLEILDKEAKTVS
jgi:recombinational DNA repair ATPase RecF